MNLAREEHNSVTIAELDRVVALAPKLVAEVRRLQALAGQDDPAVSGNYETCAVLAGAYKGKRLSQRSTLTHTVRLNEGRFAEVLCGTVDLDSMADSEADDPDAPPTCPRCAKKDPRRPAGGAS